MLFIDVMISAESLHTNSFAPSSDTAEEDNSNDDCRLKYFERLLGRGVKSDNLLSHGTEDIRSAVVKEEDGSEVSPSDNIFDTSTFSNGNVFNSEKESLANFESRDQAFGHRIALNLNNGDDCSLNISNELSSAAPNKKKRQRRNPVWPYFEVNDGIASCKQCSYTTKSVFSTNLKVHLRTHHNATYKLVIEAEEQQHAALQKSLVGSSSITTSGTTPFMHRVTTTALPAQGNGASSGSGDLSLGHILNRMCDVANNVESRGSSTPSGPGTPISSTGESDNVFDTPSTSDYDLTYSTLLNGGRIDEGCLPALNQSTFASKRRRLRRHPVWRFFKDVDGTKSVGCVKCSFNTASPFSTNLKMHLKAHHKDDYTIVLRLEAQQREEEGIRENCVPTAVGVKRKHSADETNEPNPSLKQALGHTTPKKIFEMPDEETLMSMSVSERLAAMVEIAAHNAQEDEVKEDEQLANLREANPCESFGSSASGLDAIQSSLLARFGLNGSDLMQSSPLLQKNNLLSGHTSANTLPAIRSQLATSVTSSQDISKSVRTVSKKLPTGEVVKVRMMRKEFPSAPSPNEQLCNMLSTSPVLKQENFTHTTPKSEKIDEGADAFSNLPMPNLTETVSPQNPSKGILKANESRFARDEALARFMDKSKAFNLLGMPEFKNFVQTLAPDYQLPSSGSLKRLAETLK